MSYRLAMRILGSSHSASSRAEPEPGQLSAILHDDFVALGHYGPQRDIMHLYTLPSTSVRSQENPAVGECKRAHPEEGDDVVLGDGLQQAWCPSEALQAGATS